MKPTHANNFCRVFELPTNYPNGYCFDGGKPVMFKMVDWFNPWPLGPFVKKELNTWEEVVELLRPWLMEKPYVQPGKTYILITEFGESMMFGG